MFRRALMLLCVLSGVASADPIIQVPAGIAATLSTFATGLSFPTGMVQRSDGTFLVGTTTANGPGGNFMPFFHGSGEVRQLTDANHDGVADGPGVVVAGPFPGAVTNLALAGDILVVGTTGDGGIDPNVTDLLFLAPSGGTYVEVGAMHFDHPSAYNNPAFTIAPLGGDQYDLIFQIGADVYSATPRADVEVSGLIGGGSGTNLPASGIYRTTLTTTGNTVTAGAPQQLAIGVRNSFGLRVLPSGDVVFTDNGADTSADELNRIAAGAPGVLDFGFNTGYVDGLTGAVIGSSVNPFAAFSGVNRPVGIADLALSPASFPAPLANGLFVGFHGNFFEAGASNLLNPVLYYDFVTQTTSTFIAPGQPGVGNLNGFLTTSTSLYLSDFSAGGVFMPDSGIVYRIELSEDSTTPVPEPGTLLLIGSGLLAYGWRRRRARA